MLKLFLRKVPLIIYFKVLIPLIFISMFNVIISLLIQLGVNNIVSKQPVNNTFVIIGLLITSAIIYMPILYVQYLQVEKLKIFASEYFGEFILTDILNKPTLDPTNVKEGQAINLIHEDIENLVAYIDYGFIPLISMIITLITGIIYVLFLSITIGSIFILVGFLLLIINQKIIVNMKSDYDDYIEADDAYKIFLEQLYYMIPSMRVLKIQDWLNTRYEHKLIDKQQKFFNYWQRFIDYDTITEGGIVFFEAIILIFGLFLVNKHYLSLGELIGGWNAGLGSILYPLSSLPLIYNYYAKYLSSVERIAVLSEESEQSNLDIESIEDKQTDIIVNNITVDYSEDKRALENFSAQIPHQGVHYIVGPSGSGKSTLIKALLGIVHIKSGAIINEDNESIIGRSMSYVPQTIQLFNISVRDNLILGNDAIDDQTIMEACQMSQIWSKIQQLPNGLNTIIEGDHVFSSGEKRRLGIARALLLDKNIVIMDEPFSDLDVQTQTLLFNELKRLSFQKSFVIISHELSFINEADSIIKVGNRNA